MDALIGRRLSDAERLSEQLQIPLEVRRTTAPRPFAGEDLHIVRVRRLSEPERLEVVLAAFLAPEDVAN